MNITIEYIFINPELNEIKNIIKNTIKMILKNMVIVIGKNWNKYVTFNFLIK